MKKKAKMSRKARNELIDKISRIVSGIISIIAFGTAVACIYVGIFDPTAGSKVALDANFLRTVYFLLASIAIGLGCAFRNLSLGKI